MFRIVTLELTSLYLRLLSTKMPLKRIITRKQQILRNSCKRKRQKLNAPKKIKNFSLTERVRGYLNSYHFLIIFIDPSDVQPLYLMRSL